MTADDQFRVDLQQLDDAIVKMSGFGAEVDAILDDVDRHIADLHLSWDSRAAETQRAAHTKWLAGAAEMRENLGELRDVARVAHENYSGAAGTNHGMWPT
ncbi:WXG100 family type VII secretion target [Nocardia transvalensis]|uniref:ESAT-6-like protein n=1 Tax=Nocardia transvalensis TaxID=37333 RepID=A0A7W9PLR6_9NOCA|nr:WXG100 family type VII secretion target [Nocardia transvalensis]MBB5918491.1 WXG100 family type VII secretion target [Nocardia transvalensis]